MALVIPNTDLLPMQRGQFGHVSRVIHPQVLGYTIEAMNYVEYNPVRGDIYGNAYAYCEVYPAHSRHYDELGYNTIFGLRPSKVAQEHLRQHSAVISKPTVFEKASIEQEMGCLLKGVHNTRLRICLSR